MAIDRNTVIRLLLRERTKILAYTHAIVGEQAAAEDIFQELSIMAVDRCGEIEHERHFLGWTRTVARFKALKWRERRRSHAVLLSVEAIDRLNGAWAELDQAPAQDAVSALEKCMERLTPRARNLLHLKYGEGMDGPGLARTVSRGVRSVYTALSRIHRALGDCVRERLATEMLREEPIDV